MRRTVVRTLAAASGLAILVVAGRAAVQSGTIAMAPHGDTIGGSAGQVVPLSSTSLLASTLGPDANDTSADDLTLLVTGIGGEVPVVTPIATPYLSDYSGHIVRVSATRVLLISGGPDETWGTADDALLLVSGIGTTNTVTTITVGPINEQDGFIPALLDSDTAVVQTRGPDGTNRSGDETVALVTGLSGTPVVTHLPAPYLTAQGSGRTVALSPTSFLATAAGADGSIGSADDEVYLFTDVGGANTRTDLAVPFIYYYAAGTPVPLSPSSAILCSNGPDDADMTADDQVIVLTGLDGASPTVTPVTVPSIQRYGGGRPVAVDGTTLLVSTEGPDSIGRNADDTVALITDVGGTNTVTHITVGFLSDDAVCRPTLVAPGVFAVGTSGPDGSFENADDEMVVVSDFAGTPVVVRHAFSGLDEGQSSLPLPLGPDALLYFNAGPDGDLNNNTNADDRITVLTGATTNAPTAEHVDGAGDNNTFWASQQPMYLGAGRAAFVMGGTNGQITYGADDVIQVLSGLPTEMDLRVKVAKLIFDAEAPEKGEKCSVKGTMIAGGQNPFGGAFVTLSVGNAGQVIPVSRFKGKNGSWKYSDPKQQYGWVKKFSWNSKNGKFVLSGKGVGTGMEDSDPDFCPVSLDGAGEFYLGETLDGEAANKGIAYKAPK